MTENRFQELLQGPPPQARQSAPSDNRFADLQGRQDAFEKDLLDNRQAEHTLDLADQLELPIGSIEDLYPALKQDADFHGMKLSRKPLTIVDPSDPQAVRSDPQAVRSDPVDVRIGLVEGVARMDAVDWASRFPFSPAGLFHAGDLMAAARRLKLDVYESEFTATYQQTESTEAKMQQVYVNKPRVIALPQERKTQDIALIENFLLRQQEVNDRGYTWPAKVFLGVSYLPSWMIEFMVTGGLAKLGSETAQEIGVRTLQGYAKTAGGRTALKAAGWTGAQITRATLGMPHRLGEEILQRRVQSLNLADGAIIQVQPETWATSILKGYAKHLIEVGTESTGGPMTKGGAWIARNTLGRLPFTSRVYTAMREAYMAMHSEPGTAALFADRFFDAAKYDGLLGEIGEERLATIPHALVGTEQFGLGPDSTPFERLKAGLAQDLQNFTVEAAVLAVPGAMKTGAEIFDRFSGDAATEHDIYDLLADVAALRSTDAARTYMGAAAKPDLTTEEPTATDVGSLKQLLHNWGIRSADGYEPFADKDFREIWKFLQMPDDIRRTFPQFDPVYQVQRGREMQKQVLDETLAKSAKPYFELTTDERRPVDEALVEAERNPAGPALTGAMTERQRSGFMAIRETLNACTDILIKEMEAAGVDEKTIKDFAKNIRNYVPHKWYGSYAVVVKDRLTEADRAAGVTRKPTLFMTAVPFTERYNERSRLQQLYPNQEISIVKRNDIEYEAFQEAPPWAVSRMVDLIQEKAQHRLSEHAQEVLHETLTDLYKSKGFGMHYIRRQNIPGYTEDLYKPLAEYLAGFSGYITKMRAMKAFTEALQGIHPQRTPKLYKYALDYIRYVTGDPMEFSSLKKVLYAYYLYGNIKSASLNLTQNLMLAWPVLSKHTKQPLARLMQAMARTATGTLTAEEKSFIAALESQGFLDPQMAQEISGRAGNAIYQQLQGTVGKAISYADLFKQVEGFNRRAMAVALYDSGITDLNQAAEIIDEAHFRYSKGNRPTLSRGFASPMMVFRSWNINYLTWLKNQIKAGEIGALARSMSAWILLGGARALPGMSALMALYSWIFDRDLEGDAREALRNPLSARRLYTEGARDRSGRPILDLDNMQQLKLTQTEAILKGLGYAPDRLRQEWDIRDTLTLIHAQREQLTSNWADRLVLATIGDQVDVEEIQAVLQEWERHNAKVADRGQEDLAISREELDRAFTSRLRPLNIPPASEWSTEARIRGQYRTK
jgi:hypothetical protein